jgi:hypothetical protein
VIPVVEVAQMTPVSVGYDQVGTKPGIAPAIMMNKLKLCACKKVYNVVVPGFEINPNIKG